ncbi:MAG: hypothetical protein PUB20_05045 [Clostridia bacterium]|nr:hypothetical protein [Clostridia bacterium]
MSKSDKKLAKSEKKAAKKAKKAEKKAAITPEEKLETKLTWTKAITAVVCVVAICISSSVAVGKYSNAVIESAGKGGSVASANADVSGGDVAEDPNGVVTEDPAADPGAVDPNGAVAEDPAADAGDATETPAADNGTATQTPASNGGTTNAATNDPTTYSKAQIVNYYNTSLKNSYKQKVTMTRTEKIDIAVDSMKPDSSALVSVVNKIIKNYATENTNTLAFSGGKASDGTLAADFGPKTGLTADGAKSASVKKSGSNYVVTINVVSEKATLSTPPKYNKLCAAPLDLASVDLFGVEVTKADFTYPSTVLTATINANGQVLSSSVSQPLSGTGGGKFIALSVEATAHGSWTQKITYKY